jgi:Eukaryotic aspartyl protease
VTGNVSYDFIAFENFNTNASFINAVNDSNTEFLTSLGLDGVFGLGLTESGNPPGYVSTLYNNNTISSPQFGLFFESNSLNVYFGDYEIEGYDLNTLVTVPQNTISNYWKVSVDLIQIGNASISDTTAILSVSYSIIHADEASYEQISSYYTSVLNCSNNYTFITCNKSYGNLTLQLNGVNLTVPASSLWQKSSNSYTLLIKNSTEWVLGTVLLENYFTVFNYQPPAVTFLSVVPVPINIEVIYI